jgi:hypothetical protein
MIKAVITFYYKGTTGAIGNSDGSGHMAVIITGDIYEKVIEAAYLEAKVLHSPRIQDIVMVIQQYDNDLTIKEINV